MTRLEPGTLCAINIQMNHTYRLVYLLLLLALLLPQTGSAQETFQTLWQGLTSTFHLTGDEGPEGLVWIRDGECYSYDHIQPDSGIREIRAYCPETGNDERIFSPDNHTFPDSGLPFDYESFEWSSDETYLLFRSNVQPVWRYSGLADYYLYSLNEQEIRIVAESAFTAEMSPDGKRIGIGLDGELHVLDVDSGERRQLTHDAKEHLYNGRFGWVYEEEFGKVQAWEWSPDSRRIAYWQSDERHVKRFVSTDYEGIYPEYTDIPYPKVGEENPSVRVGVMDLESGDHRWIDLDVEDGYIPRIYWTSRTDLLAITHLNRAQNHLTIYMSDVTIGHVWPILEERTDSGWIDLFDFFTGAEDHLFFPDQGESFFWLSEQDGWRHIYRYDYAGNLIDQITSGNWQVSYLHHIDTDKELILYESTEPSPLERHLYAIRFDGREKVRLSQTPGRHRFDVSTNGLWYLDRWSNAETPLQVELWSTRNGGEKIERLESNDYVRHFTERFFYSERELFRFITRDGTPRDGMMIRPVGFDPENRYPVILDIYGGPGSQGVYNEFETGGWRQYLAQQGYVIVDINNLGSGGYGRDFEKAVYRRLGHPESADYADLIRWLEEEFPWVDTGRIAIRGHSYGGYLAALAPVLYPDHFQAAISGAPVTDWRLYDTIYTERYMGLLEENREGYKESAVMTHAGQLQARLLVAHASMDENVHIQNTMQMIRAFTDHGIDVDLRIYPPGAHGVAYNRESYLLLYQTYTNFLERHLKPDQ